MPAQSKRKRKKSSISSSHLLRGFLALAGMFLLLGALVRIIVLWNNRLWDGQERITFVVTTSPPTLVSYQQHPGELKIVQFPKNLEVESAFGLGFWKLENLYKLGKQKGLGGELLAKSVQYSLGVPVDGWMSEQGLGLTVDTNFTFLDRLRIAKTLGTVSPGERQILIPEKVGMVRKVRAADGSFVYRLDNEKMREIALRELQDSLVAGEKVGVGVINATDRAGVGGQIADVVNGMGARVVWVRAGGRFTGRCELRTDTRHKSLTLRRLARLFACSLNNSSDATLPIEFVIGEELARELPSSL